MTKPTVNTEVLERLLGHLNDASQRIAKELDSQAKQIDHTIRAFVDQGEKVTARLIKTVETEMRSQLDSLQREVERLAGKVNAVVSGTTPPKPSPAAKATHPATKPAVKAARPATKPAAKPGVRAGAAKKTAARKTTARKTTAKRTAA